MPGKLENKKVALLVADGFEQVELTEPKEALEKAGAIAHIVSPSGGSVKGWKTDQWGDSFPVDRVLDDADPGEYDALVLPGGVLNPDTLRTKKEALEFVRSFFDANKPVAAICHGPWTLIDAKVVAGRRMISYASIRMDLENAGAQWSDEEVVVDRNLVTSRSPDDLPAFCRETIAKVASPEL